MKAASFHFKLTLALLDSARSDGMVTTVATRHESNDKATASFKHLSGWYSYRLVKRCQTLEAAQAVMKQLEDRGQVPQLVMDDGLSVVTQRD